MPQVRAVGEDDWFGAQEPKLLADGWLFYSTARYDPTVMRGYTPTIVPTGLGNTAGNRRKRNRPFHLTLARTTSNPLDPWAGTLRLGAVSTLNPWAAGFTPPFPLVNGQPDIPDAAWNFSATGHYLADQSFNMVVDGELAGAVSAPAGTITGTYTGLWNLGDDGTWQTGTPNSLAAYNAMVDLFARIAV